MKKFFVSLVMLLSTSAVSVFAQSSTLATLHHGGEIKTFYGTSALVEAAQAAVDGDVITLSSGTFFSPDTITKPITLKGAGMELDTLNSVVPTIIKGDLVINIPESSTNNLLVESVDVQGDIKYITLKDPQFLKCRANSVMNVDLASKLVNSNFLHCIISSKFELSTNSSATLVNCYVSEPNSVDLKTSNFEFENCVIRDDSYSHYSTGVYGGSTYYWGILTIYSSTLKNCIICYRGDNGGTNKSYYYSIYDESSVSVVNCLAVAYQYDKVRLFVERTNTTVNHTNYTTADEASVFVGWSVKNSLENLKTTRLELTDAAKAKYIGSDGTQIGIYGGKLPFNSLTNNPRITKCEVDGKTTADGKLNVKVEIAGGK
ncbi:MAG: hypothetical protein IJA98_06775 [Bacteroidaceae bacterium]|nr:hypothetical protein [Bacteroidaceae bacterium]MBQ3238757.1 hypothetical protein [Bacteroidaceae bacterium]MBQ7967867.1 hypothetical protein [Bacteroidaceae bacterium]